MADQTFAAKYGLHIQVVVTLLFFFETLMVALLKAFLVYYLRFDYDQTESRAIVSYHLFQTIAYFSAFLNGLVAMQSMTAALICLMILYVTSSLCLVGGFVILPMTDPAAPFVIALFGLGHGALKSVIHRMMKENLIGRTFTYMSAILLVAEFVVVLFLPMGVTMEAPKLTVLGLLAVVLVLLAVSILGSLFDTHDDEECYKFTQVLACTFYGLTSILMREEVKLEKDYKGIRKGAKMWSVREARLKHSGHWLDSCRKFYPAELVDDLKAKFRLHKFYWTIAGLWITVEMKYSFWIFNTYFTDRVLDAERELVVTPPQYIALTPLVFIVFGPLFYFYIRPILSKSFFRDSVRQMCLGAFFILLATGLGWRLSSMQWELSTEFMEPGAGHTKVRLLNAFDCSSGFEYFFPMDPLIAQIYRPTAALDIDRESLSNPKDKNASDRMDPTLRDRFGAQTIEMLTNILLPTTEDSFLKYASVRFLDKARVGDVFRVKLQPTDSFVYLMSIDSDTDHSVTLTTYGYCEALDEYTLKIPVSGNKTRVDHMIVYVLENQKSIVPVLHPDVDYRRDMLQRPGIRLIVSFDVKMRPVDVLKDGKRIAAFRPALKKKAPAVNTMSPIIWLKVGDGRNLVIKAMGLRLQFNYSLGTAEMVDILVTVNDNGNMMAKMLPALGPITVSGILPLAQYVIIAFGEFLLGIAGLQMMVNFAPTKLRYHVHIDWYLLLGMSNLVILIVTQIGPSIMFLQMNRLCTIVIVSFIFMLLMACRF